MAAGTSRSRSRSKIGPPVEMDHGFLQKRAHQTAGGLFPLPCAPFRSARSNLHPFNSLSFFFMIARAVPFYNPPGGDCHIPPPAAAGGLLRRPLPAPHPLPPQPPPPAGGEGGEGMVHLVLPGMRISPRSGAKQGRFAAIREKRPRSGRLPPKGQPRLTSP